MPPVTRRRPSAPPCRRRASLALALSALALFAALGTARAGGVPHLDHVIVVVMENHSYDQVRVQPYTASLMAHGATLASSFAITHPSQPNYIALWAGDLLGVLTDACPAPGTPLMAENFGHACESAGLNWRAYSENLAIIGSPACSYNGNASSGLYVRKHAPWTNFGNLDQTRGRPYTDLAVDIAAGQLPQLAFVIPNNCHNSHNSSTIGCGVPDADAWLGANLPAMISAVGPQGLVVLTWDEDDGTSGNHILTVFAGGAVLPGAVSARTVTHYAVVRTICEGLGLAPFGQAAGESAINDVWSQPTPASGRSWGELKTLYR